jgi:hypothetical protein
MNRHRDRRELNNRDLDSENGGNNDAKQKRNVSDPFGSVRNQWHMKSRRWRDGERGLRVANEVQWRKQA